MLTALSLIAPAFTMAGVYIILWVLVLIIGRHCMPIPAKIYLICCGIIDLTCLILQGIGGGMAGAAVSKNRYGARNESDVSWDNDSTHLDYNL